MLAGELYDASDAELVAERLACRQRLRQFNGSDPADVAARRAILDALFGAATDVTIEPPFCCDYGRNIRLGSKVFINFNCVVLDVMPVALGHRVLLGPAVQIYTAMHPLDAVQRRTGLEFAQPVTIGDDVWIGGGAILCPGITVGDRAVIGAGSVVTRDVPADAFVAGNPARIVRRLDPASVST